MNEMHFYLLISNDETYNEIYLGKNKNHASCYIYEKNKHWQWVALWNT